jgi:hypothetical protein
VIALGVLLADGVVIRLVIVLIGGLAGVVAGRSTRVQTGADRKRLQRHGVDVGERHVREPHRARRPVAKRVLECDRDVNEQPLLIRARAEIIDGRDGRGEVSAMAEPESDGGAIERIARRSERAAVAQAFGPQRQGPWSSPGGGPYANVGPRGGAIGLHVVGAHSLVLKRRRDAIQSSRSRTS